MSSPAGNSMFSKKDIEEALSLCAEDLGQLWFSRSQYKDWKEKAEELYDERFPGPSIIRKNHYNGFQDALRQNGLSKERERERKAIYSLKEFFHDAEDHRITCQEYEEWRKGQENPDQLYSISKIYKYFKRERLCEKIGNDRKYRKKIKSVNTLKDFWEENKKDPTTWEYQKWVDENEKDLYGWVGIWENYKRWDRALAAAKSNRYSLKDLLEIGDIDSTLEEDYEKVLNSINSETKILSLLTLEKTYKGAGDMYRDLEEICSERELIRKPTTIRYFCKNSFLPSDIVKRVKKGKFKEFRLTDLGQKTKNFAPYALNYAAEEGSIREILGMSTTGDKIHPATAIKILGSIDNLSQNFVAKTREIQKDVEITGSNLSTILSELEDKGYILRWGKKRKREAGLSGKGWAVMNEYFKPLAMSLNPEIKTDFRIKEVKEELDLYPEKLGRVAKKALENYQHHSSAFRNGKEKSEEKILSALESLPITLRTPSIVSKEEGIDLHYGTVKSYMNQMEGEGELEKRRHPVNDAVRIFDINEN